MKHIGAYLSRMLGIITAVTTVALCSLPVAAYAATGASAAADTGGHAAARTTTPMMVVGVTRLVTSRPDRAGQVHVQLANGAIIAIPAADKNLVMGRAAEEARTAHPNGTVHGSCGSSWIYLYEKADAHPVKVYTGFKVKLAAISYSWHYSVTGPEHTSITGDLGGGLAFRHKWSNTYNTKLDFPQGDYSAKVTKTSFAVLATGDVCFSLGPTAKNLLKSPDAPVSWSLSTAGASTAAAPSVMPAVTSVPAYAGRRGGISPDSVIGKDTRKRVEDTTAFPYSAIALLNLTFSSGGHAACTGFLISADLVATAGHCVDTRALGKLTKALVIPGNNVNDRPFGTCKGTTAYSVTGWVNDKNSLYDYGAIKLNCKIGNTTGWFGFSWTPKSLTGTSVTITGYPGDKKPAGSMWTASGKITASAERQVFYTIPTSGGQSGSPAYKAHEIAVAIHTQGVGGSHPHANAGTRITQAAFDNLYAWRS
jgi:glutamyl endopeptidase